MHFTLIGTLAVLGILVGMMGTLEVGRRIGMCRMARDPEGAQAGSGVIDGAVFGLLALLIAFTFSGAAARFDARRTMIVEEANSIGTAWLRLDLLPASAQPALREKFRQYLDARLSAFRKIPDLAAAKTDLARANALQTEIWTSAVAACRDSGSQPATMLLLPALNQMFDVATSRTTGVQMRPPLVIYLLLGLLVLAGSFLAGYGMAMGKIRNWIHALAFVLVMSVAVYVILDYEFPRVGFIRIQGFDEVLMDLQQSIKP
jgi:hypothetical protein